MTTRFEFKCWETEDTESTPEYAGNTSVELSGESDYWKVQAELFFRFLLAQGFMVTEKMMMDFFHDRALEVNMGRANV